MHPEISRERPGSCPICGMALEPRTVSATPNADPELARHEAPASGLAWSSTLPLLSLPWRRWRGAAFAPASGPGGTVAWIQFLLASPGGRLGWHAVSSAAGPRSSIRKPQHVHPDRPGDRRQLIVYSAIATLGLEFSRTRCAPWEVSRGLFRRRCRHRHCWSCWRQVMESREPAATPAAPSAPCSISAREMAHLLKPMAASETFRSTRSPSADASASVRRKNSGGRHRARRPHRGRRIA